MFWRKFKEFKPKIGQFCLVYGVYRDIFHGVTIKEGFDYAWVTDENYFTIGKSRGQTFEVQYWMPLQDLPTLEWTDDNQIREIMRVKNIGKMKPDGVM
jgi:hypothetical protein